MVVPHSFISSLWLPSLGVLGSAIVLVLILSILAVIRTESSPTPINQLIRLDCFLRLTNIPYVLYWTGHFNYRDLDSTVHCSVWVSIAFATSLVTGLLGLSIPIYRWVFVCHPSCVLKATQRRALLLLMSGSTALLTASFTFCAFLYRESWTLYHRCLGWTWGTLGGPISFLTLPHSFYPAILCIFPGSILLTPVLYGLIFKFRRHQNKKDIGLSGASRMARIKRNIVTVKFNFLIWLSETLILLCFMPIINEQENPFLALFLILSSCLNPIIYYAGIESNQKRIRALTEYARGICLIRRLGQNQGLFYKHRCYLVTN